jgi:hypothetical protein
MKTETQAQLKRRIKRQAIAVAKKQGLSRKETRSLINTMLERFLEPKK